MVDLSALPPLREVIAAHNLGARKSLGQHFLLDMNLTGRIARSAGPLDQGTTIEIGPGPGGLTRALLAAGAAHLVVIERDDRAIAIQKDIQALCPQQMEILAADAMAVDVATLGQAPRRVVANLPYNISTALLLQWLRHATAFDSLTLMFQKEVVDRLAAAPHSPHYGRLSVITQWLCQVNPLFQVDRRAFTPPPAVESTVVQLIPYPQPRFPAEMTVLEKVTAAAFGQRRKMLRSSLKALGDAPALLAEAGLDPTARAEEIPVEGFCALARAVAARDNKTPPAG